jgi:hypothetical protein
LVNDGQFRDSGGYAASEKEVESIFINNVAPTLKSWTKPKILLYAHGGLVPEKAAVQRVAEYRSPLLANEIFPISFIWKTDYWTTIKNILRDSQNKRRPEGFIDSAKDFLLDRADDALEPLARILTGKAVWGEMKENAVLATTTRKGAARKVALVIYKLLQDPALAHCELHLVGHSAGSIFLGPLAKLLASPAGAGKIGATGFGLKLGSVTLWAPACTIEFFRENYVPVMRQIGSFNLFTLTDEAEQADNCANIYHKSLLYLVSHAFEATPHVPLLSPGEPILGMTTWIQKAQSKDAVLRSLFIGPKKIDWILAPNTETEKSGRRSTSMHHSDFDDDEATVKSTLIKILGTSAATTIAREEITMRRSATSKRDRRRFLVQQTPLGTMS